MIWQRQQQQLQYLPVISATAEGPPSLSMTSSRGFLGRINASARLSSSDAPAPGGHSNPEQQHHHPNNQNNHNSSSSSNKFKSQQVMAPSAVPELAEDQRVQNTAQSASFCALHWYFNLQPYIDQQHGWNFFRLHKSLHEDGKRTGILLQAFPSGAYHPMLLCVCKC